MKRVIEHANFRQDAPAHPEEPTRTIERAVIAFAGCMVPLSVALVHFVSPWFLLFTAFIGLNLLQSAFTGLCPAAMVFKGIGCRVGEAFR